MYIFWNYKNYIIVTVYNRDLHNNEAISWSNLEALTVISTS